MKLYYMVIVRYVFYILEFYSVIICQIKVIREDVIRILKFCGPWNKLNLRMIIFVPFKWSEINSKCPDKI
jgi:hypothetical protein